MTSDQIKVIKKVFQHVVKLHNAGSTGEVDDITMDIILAVSEEEAEEVIEQCDLG